MAIDQSEIDAFNQFLAQLRQTNGTPDSLEDAIREFRAEQRKQTPAEVVDPRDARMGPATSPLTKELRALRKQHLAEGGRFLSMDEIDEMVADCQGSLSEQD